MKAKEYMTVPFIYKLLIASAVFIFILVVANVLGASKTSFNDVWLALLTNESNNKLYMLRDIRFPRTVAAVFVGAALAVSGAIMQGLTRNPLADPGLLGLTTGANLALAITIVFFPNANYFNIMIACFIGAAIGTLLVLSIGSAKKGGFSPLRIVLAGAAVTAFLGALTEGIAIYFKVSKNVSMWTAGGLIGATWEQILTIGPFILMGFLISLLLAKQLTILSLSEEVAVGLGQNTLTIKIILFVVIIILAGAAVALVGNMAFIGLMVPHIVRAFVGNDYRFILPMSIIFGASFMLLADLAGRTISAPYEIPVAAIISIIGLPFFLFIVRKGGKAFL
ncbi:FecCD family ABC transporter permease [Haloplasma contractile]|uniref:Ferrichrome transport system permease protein fhuB n=1 Tax=Haloplasma contractile SSD-17B TaxID=1033810 RepID=F7Q107_9MOLU|nr:iron ABC transporter permease [Haloplasma contractile]ERJ11350.1 Ferrichrome transport system permease protein fhuB [Haloplasma contractile SSD-17B]